MPLIEVSVEVSNKRLMDIVNHLRTGKLAHERFDFNFVNLGNWADPDVEPNKCGTSGCAIGEFPVIWPDVFKWNRNSVQVKRKNKKQYFDPHDWLGLTWNEYKFLFYPEDGSDTTKNNLKPESTKEQVADHIENFVNNRTTIAPTLKETY